MSRFAITLWVSFCAISAAACFLQGYWLGATLLLLNAVFYAPELFE